MFASLSRQLLLVWVLIVVGCLGTATLLFVAWRQTGSVQLAQARAGLSTDCASMVSRYNGASEAARSGSTGNGLADVVVQLVLAQATGVEGGVWDEREGFVAYAYPTYQGSGRKTDVPDAERDNLATTAAAALKRVEAVDYTRGSDRETLMIAACPLDTHRVAWAMTRVARAPGRSSTVFAVGAAVLLALALTSAAGLAAIIRRWSRRIAAVEVALSTSAAVPDVPRTGSPELDRIADAVVAYATRLADSHRQASELATELQRHERLAVLGRMTATVAHEIRNPIGTLRLAAENALALPETGGGTQLRPSLELVLLQVRKLDDLVETLLGMVHPVRVRLADVEVAAWARRIVDGMGADRERMRLDVTGAPATWPMDATQVERAMENLLRNALRHADDGTDITWQIGVHDAVLVLSVNNRGPGVSPAVADRLFEPFASDRLDGNGLGLALVREVAQAHGGDAHYQRNDEVTSFIVELPWH